MTVPLTQLSIRQNFQPHARTIIVIFSHLNAANPWINAAMRTIEVFIGAGVGLLGGYFGVNLPGLDAKKP
ncbi:MULTISPECIES: hypothetical protein [Acidithiobacillus]|jgi:hypothetical protein|uniref:hypothetical protein n=1 Tax=Acidithiobacillus TaxID=119977 RepID=UPI000262512B|nr:MULTISPECIES: hypothetical protein [Acidithiobacillus]